MIVRLAFAGKWLETLKDIAPQIAGLFAAQNAVKELGLTVPDSLLARADEVID